MTEGSDIIFRAVCGGGGVQDPAKRAKERLPRTKARALRDGGNPETRRFEEVNRSGQLAALHVCGWEHACECAKALTQGRRREREIARQLIHVRYGVMPQAELDVGIRYLAKISPHVRGVAVAGVIPTPSPQKRDFSTFPAERAKTHARCARIVLDRHGCGVPGCGPTNTQTKHDECAGRTKGASASPMMPRLFSSVISGRISTAQGTRPYSSWFL